MQELPANVAAVTCDFSKAIVWTQTHNQRRKRASGGSEKGPYVAAEGPL